MNDLGHGVHLHHDDRYGDELRVEPAAWTTPRTWVTSELVTSSIMNTHVRDNLLDVSRAYARLASAVDIVNTAVSTNFVSQSIGAGDMSTDRAVRLTVIGDYLNNSGSSQTLAMAVTLNSAILWHDTTTATIAASATRRPFRLTLEVANLASASSQILTGAWWLGAAVAGAGAGIGDIDGGGTVTVFGGTSTENTASAATLALSAQHGAANANLSFRKKYAVLELL